MLHPNEIFLIGDNYIITDTGEILKSDFETFLKKNDLLEWGDNEGNTGTHTLPEYYANDQYLIKDLRDYVSQMRDEIRKTNFAVAFDSLKTKYVKQRSTHC
jgi:hypothetical protein